MSKLNIGVVGVGGRGYWLTKDVILSMEDISVVSVCDVYEDRAIAAAEMVKESRGTMPAWETDYKNVIDNPDVQAVVVPAAWEAHVDVAVYAMLKGKAVAIEVGGAYDLADYWRLVDTYEQTGTPFMFLENCCFGRREMMVLNMVK